MKTYEFAKKMEVDGKRMYEEEAARTDEAGLKRILLMLAEEEQKHYEIFDRMQKKAAPDASDGFSIAGVKNVFEEMKTRGDSFDFDAKQRAFYKKAAEIEEKSVNLYLEMAEDADDESAREALVKIACEEKKHRAMLYSIYDFVNRPSAWLEDAEWNHLDDEY